MVAARAEETESVSGLQEPVLGPGAEIEMAAYEESKKEEPMNISDMQKKKAVLEELIANEIRAFAETTALHVVGLEMDENPVKDAQGEVSHREYLVRIHVEL